MKLTCEILRLAEPRQCLFGNSPCLQHATNSHLSHHCDKIPNRQDLKVEVIYLDSNSIRDKAQTLRGACEWLQKAKGLKVAGHM